MSTTGFLLSETYGMNLTVLKFQGGLSVTGKSQRRVLMWKES